VARIPDVSGDGINDLIVGLLYQNNHVYVFDGTNGSILFTTPYPQAVDALAVVPDLTFDNSSEFVAGGRQGKVVVYAGGPVEVTGVQPQLQTAGNLKVYPNPLIDYTNIEYLPATTGKVEFCIFDLSGKEVWRHSHSAIAAHPIRWQWNGNDRKRNKLKPSVYFLEATEGQKRIRQKLFIAK
ncbi:MAG: T9SS type A sorting domain-containing protein, partial [Bacteroidia bacterium]|nr:T9SS type A sorting domain-containing protein [Bacteroidia bacterium]